MKVLATIPTNPSRLTHNPVASMTEAPHRKKLKRDLQALGFDVEESFINGYCVHCNERVTAQKKSGRYDHATKCRGLAGKMV